MKQVLVNLKSGDVVVDEVPTPVLKEGGILVENHFSAISGGTESGLLKLAGSSYIGKARQKPDLFRKVVDLARKQGPLVAYEQAMNRLNRPEPLGYSSAGVVVEVSAGSPFRVGDRVACGGVGYANHADAVFVPNNLAVKVPDEVALRDAAFTTIGAIAMQGFRNAKLALGEKVLVIGLGLIGQITVQILKAAGMEVFGVDIDRAKVELAMEGGMDAGGTRGQESILEQVLAFSGGRGVDAVIITAATTSNDPLEFAGKAARKKGRVVLVGVVGMEIPRDVYYPKELEFVVSCSYGPGRYDKDYEEMGHDYPIGYVRWTEKRNMESFLHLLKEGKIELDGIITHEFSIDEAPRAYSLISGKVKEPYLGIVLRYPEVKESSRRVELSRTVKKHEGNVCIGWIGAGAFATSVLLPAIRNITGSRLIGLSAASGLSSKSAGETYGFEYVTTDYKDILRDDRIDAVVIATRNSLHAAIAIEALEYGKHVFVEKPMAITKEELESIKETHEMVGDRIVHVGFNRRHAPLALRMKEIFKGRRGPMMVLYRVNAEHLPPDHWVYEDREGGSRFVTEMCHFIDFCKFLTSSKIASSSYINVESGSMDVKHSRENVVMNLGFKDGSVAAIIYTTIGDPSHTKEYCEVFSENTFASLKDFRELTWSHDGRTKTVKERLKVDKGHRGELQAFIDNVRNGVDPFEEWLDTTEITLS